MIFKRDYRLFIGPEASIFVPGAIQPLDDGQVLVDAVVIRPDADLSFEITKTAKKEINSVKFTIYGLSQQSREKIAQDQYVYFQAGYENNMSTLFVGTVSNTLSYFNGTEYITVVEAGDGYVQTREGYISRSFGKGVRVITIVSEIITRMGLTIGVFDNRIEGVDQEERIGKGLNRQYLNGYTAQGNTYQLVSKVCEDNGLAFFIEDERANIFPVESTTGESALILNKELGLIGSPQPMSRNTSKRKGSEGDPDKGVVFSSLLNPNIRLSRKIELTSKNYPDGVVLEPLKIIHRGSYRGTDWDTVAEAKIL